MKSKRTYKKQQKKTILDIIKLASLETILQAGIIFLIINVIEFSGIGMIFITEHNLRSDNEIGIMVALIIIVTLLINNFIFELPYLFKIIKRKNIIYIFVIASIESIIFLVMLFGFIELFGLINLIQISFEGFSFLFLSIMLAMTLSNILNAMFLK